MGCSAPKAAPVTPPPAPLAAAAPAPASAKGLQPVLVEPAIPAEAVATEIATTVTTSQDELISFVERTIGEGTLPPVATTSLAERGAWTTRLSLHEGTWTCLARRTQADERAAVMRSSKNGFLVVPIAWMAKVVSITGAKDDDARAWYQAMSQRIATAGRATGLARFANGNAEAILLELRPLDDTDIALVVKTQFMKAGEFTADAWGPVITGAERVRTSRMNGHSGVSIVDLLRELPRAKPTGTQAI